MNFSQCLFDNLPRSDEGPKNQSEPSFNYLNRSARPDVASVRRVLEEWFSRFPIAAQTDLHNRFRSDDNRQHLGAFFELYLHELLCRLGMTVEVHPASPGEKRTHPDFKVFKGDEAVFYLEATLAASSNADVSAEKIKDRLYNALDGMNSPNFFVQIEDVEGAPATAPSAKQLRRFLEDELKNLDPDAIARQIEEGGISGLPSWTWRCQGWVVTFRPIPKSPEIRGKPGVRPVGAYRERWSYEGPQEGIRGAIRKKMSARYGNLDLPYIVAVNALDVSVDQDDIDDVLFGDKQLTTTRYQDGSIKENLSRKPNGVFYGPEGPWNRRVSGLLMLGSFCGFWPWNAATEVPVLWHHPWASRPLVPEMWPLTQMVFDSSSSQMVKREGVDIADLLRLPHGWPRSP